MSCLDARGQLSMTPEDAAVIIVNSCGFIESAKQESITTVLELRARFPYKKIILAGCLARRYESELNSILTEVDLVYGSPDMKKLVCLATADDSPFLDYYAGERPLLSSPGSAYVKISEGCNNNCSFCAIPQIRGGLSSRSIDDIDAECTALLQRGIRELCLVAQDTASFGCDVAGKSLLAPLLERLALHDGVFWIRLLYLHPDHFPFEILPIMQHDSRIIPYFDIPFQHAAPKILRNMRRSGNARLYLELIERIRTELPDAVIRSTFLAGFPGENTAAFDELAAFQEAAQLDWMGVFAYSREEKTGAWYMKPQIARRTAERRKRILEQTQTKISEQKLDRFTGRTLDVLVEEAVGIGGFSIGRAYIHAPEVDGVVMIETECPLVPGSFVKVVITGHTGFDLQAIIP
jgi:ribosomal protein S12 methylthiotransferase